MDITQHSPGLYLTQHPADLFDVCGAVVKGENRVVVWDTLLHPDDMKDVPALAAGKPITVVYSHADWDHVWGTGGLEPTEVVAHENCAARFRDPEDVAKTLREKQAEDVSYNAVHLVPPTRTFKESLTLELGGITLKLHPLPGHTKDCIVGFIPELGVLLGGDTCEDPLPVVYADSRLGAWIRDLERWRDNEQVHTVIPSHGAVSSKPGSGKDLLARNIAYLKALREGRTPDVPAEMDAFYTETHAVNMKRAVVGS